MGKKIERLLLVVAFVTLVLLLNGCANHVFYIPDRTVYGDPANDAIDYEEVTFQSVDGIKLNGWFFPSRNGKSNGTVVFFHGNAQNMTSHYSLVDWIPVAGFNLFIFDYRGYGKSQGLPERRGVSDDCVGALNYIVTRPDVDPNKLLVLGQSLGGANAIVAAGRWQGEGSIRGAIIESAFYTHRRIAFDHITNSIWGWLLVPYLPILVSTGFDPKNFAQRLSMPVVYIHGTADRIVPFYHSLYLYRRTRQPKDLWIIEGGRHIAAFKEYRSVYIPRATKFFEECLQEKTTR